MLFNGFGTFASRLGIEADFNVGVLTLGDSLAGVYCVVANGRIGVETEGCGDGGGGQQTGCKNGFHSCDDNEDISGMRFCEMFVFAEISYARKFL